TRGPSHRRRPGLVSDDPPSNISFGIGVGERRPPRTTHHPPTRSCHMIEPVVYLNGRMVPASQAHLAIFDAGIVLGATVTEMTRTFLRRPWRLDQHLDRLFRSLRYTRMDIGLSKEQLADISCEVVAHNARLIGDGEELGLIHFITAGEFPTYAGMAGRPARTTPTVCSHTFPMPFELWVKKMQTRTPPLT